jgi:prolyl 4-hydroxylase
MNRRYEPATVQTENGPRLVDFIRNNNRVTYKDNDLANELWSAVKDYAPASIGESEAIGLNELFRFYKYQPGQQFKKHRDQSYIRNSKEASYFTFMIYLNDDFKGGATTFNDLVVTPKGGSALIFYHYIEHEGSEVLEGTKYVLRTDIMFRLK